MKKTENKKAGELRTTQAPSSRSPWNQRGKKSERGAKKMRILCGKKALRKNDTDHPLFATSSVNKESISTV